MQGTRWVMGSYLSVAVQSVYSTTLADWAIVTTSVIFHVNYNKWNMFIQALLESVQSRRINFNQAGWNKFCIGITVTFMFHSCFSSPPRSRYLSLFSLSVLPRDQLEQQSPLLGSLSSFFFFFDDYHRSGRLAEIRWSVCTLTSQ